MSHSALLGVRKSVVFTKLPSLEYFSALTKRQIHIRVKPHPLCTHVNYQHIILRKKAELGTASIASSTATPLHLWVFRFMHTQKSCIVGCDKACYVSPRLYFSVFWSPQRAGRCVYACTREGGMRLCVHVSAFLCHFNELILFRHASNCITIVKTCWPNR